MTSQTPASNQIGDQYPLFTDLKFTLSCPRQPDDDECGICTIDVTNQQTLTHANGFCKVAYCLECWETLFERLTRCPNCRGELTFDQTVESNSLVGKTKEIHEQPWLTRKRHRAMGYDWLRNRYRLYNVNMPLDFISSIATLPTGSQGLFSDFNYLFDWRGPWPQRLRRHFSIFLDLVWSYQALGQHLNLDRLHVHPDLEEAIFESVVGEPSVWSRVESDLTKGPQRDLVKRIVRLWARNNAETMNKVEWWDNLQIRLEPRYLREEADRVDSN